MNTIVCALVFFLLQINNMNQTNYVDMFENNVRSRMKDVHFYQKNTTSNDLKPAPIFVGVIIGAIICKLAKL